MVSASAAGAGGLRRLQREQVVVASALFVLAAVAWGLTDRRMAGMGIGPTTDLGGLGFYTTVWVVMMAAMMFPSVWPVVAIYDGIGRAKAEAPRSATWLVIGGYLLVWTAWGVLAFAAIEAGH